MNGGGNFFVEDAFGEVYNGSFFAEDMENFLSHSQKSPADSEEAAIRSATSQVRMSTESEVLRESDKAFASACDFGRNLGSGYLPHFAGKIFGNF